MEILASLREAFGSPTMSESDAVSKVQSLIQEKHKNSDNAQKVTDLQGQLTAKNDEITALKAKIPAKLDEKLAAAHVDLACRELKVLSSEGKCTPAQANAFVEALKPEGKANINFVAADGTVFLPIATVAEAFGLNKTFAVGKELTAAQKETRQTPGDPNPENKTVSAERIKELMATVGYTDLK